MQLEYVYQFEALGDELSYVILDDFKTGQRNRLKVKVLDKQLLFCSQKRVPAEIADLIDLATAVYTADRLCVTQQRNTPRYIRIILPVRHPDTLNQTKIVKKLHELLHWFTNDQWFFQFVQRQQIGRLPERQYCFLTEEDTKKEICLWSGGLDSLAGLYTRIKENTSDRYILIGTGGNHYIQNVQKKIAAKVKQNVSKHVDYIPIPIRLAETDGISKNSRPRSRGFIFMLMGAAAALLNEQTILHIYENGVGAINLNYREVEIGLDNSRAVHPVSMIGVGELISNLFDIHFEFRNPFLFWTKTQMCSALIEDKLTDLMFSTVTCDRRQRKAIMQCGLCSSCLLRQQSLLAAGVEDKTKYLIDSPAITVKTFDQSYFRAMIYQLDDLERITNSPTPWYNLERQYSGLLEVVARYSKYYQLDKLYVEQELVDLYRTYVEEWRRVQNIIQRKIVLWEQFRVVA